MAATLLGYARALARGPDLDWQHELLRANGVTERLTWTDGLNRKDPRAMFGEVGRALRGGDVLVVSCLGVFARNRAEIISGMQGLRLRNVTFWSIEDEIDTRQADAEIFFKLGDGIQAAQRIWNRERTAKASSARRGHKIGRRPKLGPKRDEEARSLWLDPNSEQTNNQVAEQVGLSANRLYRKFGPRPRSA